MDAIYRKLKGAAKTQEDRRRGKARPPPPTVYEYQEVPRPTSPLSTPPRPGNPLAAANSQVPTSRPRSLTRSSEHVIGRDFAGDLASQIRRLLSPYSAHEKALGDDGVGNVTREQRLESHEILAATNALTEQWEMAYLHAQKAIDGHYELVGRDSDATMRAIGLMALICRRADNDDAEYWLEMLPADKTIDTLLGPARREQPEPRRDSPINSPPREGVGGMISPTFERR